MRLLLKIEAKERVHSMFKRNIVCHFVARARAYL